MKPERFLFLIVPMWVQVATAQSNVDSDQKFGWCENIGWSNWRDASEAVDGVRVSLTFLAGFIWSENAGWINVGDGLPGGDCGGRPCYANLDADDFGVNVGEDGLLSGLAWGENIGWINFDSPPDETGHAEFDFCARRLVGFAWGENVGWMNLHDASSYIGVGPCVFGDADCDGSVGSGDFTLFASFLAGPDVPSGCPAFDADGDGDVDLLDSAEWQNTFGN